MICLHQLLSFLTPKPFRRGFTLIEIMVVVITLGVIASLALKNYNKVVEKSHCNNARHNIIRIQSGIQIWRVKNGYNADEILDDAPFHGLLLSIAEINTLFGTLIVDDKFEYGFNDMGSGGNVLWACRGTCAGPQYILLMKNEPINDTNPSACP